MNLIQTIEAEEIAKAGKTIPEFRPGDTLKVNVKVVEQSYDEKAKQMKTRERLQAFEGVCIARQGAGLNESFTVRKISYGEGVERVFPVYSPLVDTKQFPEAAFRVFRIWRNWRLVRNIGKWRRRSPRRTDCC